MRPATEAASIDGLLCGYYGLRRPHTINLTSRLILSGRLEKQTSQLKNVTSDVRHSHVRHHTAPPPPPHPPPPPRHHRPPHRHAPHRHDRRRRVHHRRVRRRRV